MSKIAMTALALVLAVQAPAAFAQPGRGGGDRAERAEGRGDGGGRGGGRSEGRGVRADREVSETRAARAAPSQAPQAPAAAQPRFRGGDGTRAEGQGGGQRWQGRGGGDGRSSWEGRRGGGDGQRVDGQPRSDGQPAVARPSGQRFTGGQRPDGQPRGDGQRGGARWSGGDRRDWDRNGDGRRDGDRREWSGRDDRRGDGRRDGDRRDWGRNDGRSYGDRSGYHRGGDRWAGGSYRHWERGRYPSTYYSAHRYRYAWRAPIGFYVRTWAFGDFFPRAWYGPEYWIVDPWQYDLPLPPPGFAWVRSGADALMIDEYTGQVVQVVRDVFWY